ncbi:hypothetical protein GYO_1334 [Bacillus spizizenii TU-B-10]|uniref:Uncharacterized protein n=1 Tax=Bacillus spizizenii (strain DSM 15029 / JCM 12233 / NBRC 101239 / NRRL B-23049 / TU-B-10) TaxID=1052585 RepID=G4NRS9_BACS4|nr:hypothetical protein GYO_1334 [Bacillus spizizenii TU-B-10]SCV44587.1 hypothetical protein BQ1740_4191 [Bacillus subtilis]
MDQNQIRFLEERLKTDILSSDRTQRYSSLTLCTQKSLQKNIAFSAS